MKTFYKIYHYSNKNNLEKLETKFYGTGITQGAECKRGKSGIDKIYFYTADQPETIVKSGAFRYEIYLPFEWKNLIYRLDLDPENLFQEAKDLLKAKREYCYDYRLWEEVEKLIFSKGYKGWSNPQHTQLPHVIVLFESISAKSPQGISYQVLDWNENFLEIHRCADKKVAIPNQEQEANSLFFSTLSGNYSYPDK